ncbi:hypothetical protein COLO4_19785 [Corchorus olitorius]|uniref:Uncharacterized protein n=1 Tax=Corchorus olitorius TaxID=93759 RepID=A0A1R3J3K2_9ROSI|nr:hypothetical protein COLO4_19785 [Corchorus olitorius]
MGSTVVGVKEAKLEALQAEREWSTEVSKRRKTY